MPPRIELSIIFLDDLNITYTKRFMVGRKFFDIRIKNVLIDVNSDLWHANPSIYKENDTLKFPFKNVKARTIWQRDLRKKKSAESYGYKIYYIWENDIKDLSDEENRDLMMSVVSDILPKFKNLTTFQKRKLENRIKFLSTVTKEIQKSAEALSASAV